MSAVDVIVDNLHKQGYYGVGGVFADKSEAVKEGKAVKDRGYQVKMLEHKTRWGIRYTLYRKKI